MKKVFGISLILSLVIISSGYNSKPVLLNGSHKHANYADPILGCFEYGGVWYTVYGKYPNENIITRIAWYNTYTSAYPNPSLGSFYVNSNNILCVSTTIFTGQNGAMSYDGRLYVCQ